jgi:hypothetical protein
MAIVTARAQDLRLSRRLFDDGLALEAACAPQWRTALTETELRAQLSTVVELTAWLRDSERDWADEDAVLELLVRLTEAEALLQLARQGVGAHLVELGAAS